MAEIQENNIQETNKEPLPLSLEGGAGQLELEIKPKPVTKPTPVSFNKVSIKNIIDTPKEGPQMDGTSNGTPPPPGPPKEDNQAILSRLNDGDKTSSDKTPPSPDEAKDTAGMFIDGFNALFLFFIELWSKDPETQDYEVETEEKTKLKKYLAAIVGRMENKINPLWLFIGILFITYVPMLRKAYKHKKMVAEQRAKDDPNTIVIDGVPKRKRRKKNSNSEPEFYHAEVVK